jgi:hypothetical protein
MTQIEQQVLGKLQSLAPEDQMKVLAFVESLAPALGGPRRSVEGLWSDLEIHLSAQEIDEARREMWASFPREVA